MSMVDGGKLTVAIKDCKVLTSDLKREELMETTAQTTITGYCWTCRENMTFKHFIRYNFGDPNLGVANEWWECENGHTWYSMPPKPKKD
jgi:hypothetical protein